MSAPGMRRRRSTAPPISSSTWRSRAQSGAARAPSPRRSRRSAATGNHDHDRFVALAAELLSAMPAERAVTTEAARYIGGEHRQGRDLEQLHLVLGFPGLALGDPDYYAASVLSTAFGGGMSSRLFQEVREKRGLVYTIHSFAHSFRDGGIFGIYAGTGEAEAGALVPVLCEETMRLADGLTDIELARAKAQMKAGLLMSLESTGARCEQMRSE